MTLQLVSPSLSCAHISPWSLSLQLAIILWPLSPLGPQEGQAHQTIQGERVPTDGVHTSVRQVSLCRLCRWKH